MDSGTFGVNLVYSIGSKLSFRSRAVTNLNFSETLFSFILAPHALSDHLILVPWVKLKYKTTNYNVAGN